MKTPRIIRLNINVPAVVASYADRWENGECDNYSLKDYCQQARLDVQLPKFGQWVRDEIERRDRQRRMNRRAA